MAYYQQYESPRYPNDCDGGCGQQQNYGYNQSEYNYSEQQRYHSLPQGQIVRVCSKANPDYALGIRDGRATLVYYNPSDPTQQWVKDESWSNRVRDTVGHPAFGLVNKATGQALRHAPAACQEVLLTKYEAGSYDESVLWSESEDMGYGYRTIRMANDIGLNLDAFQGDRKHGGIEEGTRVVLWKWNKQDNQLWKISPCY
ncbi:ricin B-like lectin R40G3 [Cryptomeria japonica]|uniref:ricin B-like lectin R40G3 n=1 Tax=Cryptomeria japonica TaxID=3369 RepID=UPI0027DA059E|nr:ricin B-like lectin R40G3 [Cryptomeria japonica]